MKRHIRSLSLVGVVALLAAAPLLRAADVKMTEIDMMRSAYKTLAFADHDYKGHRAAAMHAIEAACDKLGTDIRGDGKGHELQPVSDDKLKAAKQMLEQAREIVAGRHQDAIAHHIDEAIKEVSIALTIR
jgi:hypothetical protein